MRGLGLLTTEPVEMDLAGPTGFDGVPVEDPVDVSGEKLMERLMLGIDLD